MEQAGNDRWAAAELLEVARQRGYGLPVRQPHGGHAGHSSHEPGITRTVRTATHRGREIRIETTYRVTIDAEPFAGVLEVLDNGLVHYHGFPQYALPSAVDMVRTVIDHFGSKPPVDDELGELIEDAER